MSKFYFQIIDDDEVTASIVEFESDTWLDAFPKFLAVCRAAEFTVSPDTAMYAPTASRHLFGDRDFLIFEDELIKDNDNAKYQCDARPGPIYDIRQEEPKEPKGPGLHKTLDQWASEGGLNHSQSFYDPTRNR